MIPGICPHGTCENLEPGYKCICDPGFHPDDDGICRDIDECDMHQSVSIFGFSFAVSRSYISRLRAVDNTIKYVFANK